MLCKCLIRHTTLHRCCCSRGLIAASAFLRVVILESHTPTDLEDYWGGLYEVLVLSFGQQFPDFSADLVHQAFSVVVAGIGLAAFALVLALVEQVVLVSG